jgi:hypothetical protein
MGTVSILIKGMVLGYQQCRLAVRLWVINLIFSLFAIGPLFFLMMDHMSHSLSGEHALQKLDLFWLADFAYRFMNITPALVGTVLLAAVIYLLLSVFLNGGIIGCLNRPQAQMTLADFFHDCGLYFGRLFRLFLLSIPAYLAVLVIWYSLVQAFLEIFSRRAATEWPALIVRNLRLLALVLLLTVVAMFSDYVKIGLVAGARKKVLEETRRTLKFIGRRFFKAWGLYLLAGLVFVALTLLYLEIARLLPQNRPLQVLLAFLWQQFYILCRQWSKVLFFATELEFFRQHKEPAQST